MGQCLEPFYEGGQVPRLFLCRLAHFLSSDIRQVVVFVVRLMVSPHHKNNLQPFRSQSPKRLVVIVSPSPLISIVSVRPLTQVAETWQIV